MDWEVITQYQLGYVAEPLKGDYPYTGMLTIPYITQSGVKALKFRRLTGTGPKYGQHEGQRPRLFNPGVYFTADTEVGICEGEIDAIVATTKLGIPSMGVPGVEMWAANAKSWVPIFKDFGRVWIFADGDPLMCMCSPRCPAECLKPVRPGEQLARRIAQSLGWRAQIVWCPEGEDVASMVATGKEAALLDQIGRDE